MALASADFFVGGPAKSADILQFYNLLTGTMTDQPVILANTLRAGGSGGTGAVPFQVDGVAGLAVNLVEFRLLPTDAIPTVCFDFSGNIRMGPGGAGALDTLISRVGGNLVVTSGADLYLRSAAGGTVHMDQSSLVVADTLTGNLVSGVVGLQTQNGFIYLNSAGTSYLAYDGTYLYLQGAYFRMLTIPGFATGDKYLVVNSAGVVHASALGPVS